ncbi:MAG: TetR/AcrR family transcriptional regulator [Betaproteobacteria bacterium]|nr:TetR/AcrR family transcriptional regulator [Betaproteobacteria bacterium]
MPRARADDYDDKTKAILDSAAALFARIGYPDAKMQDIAKACGASKSMLYHYFETKDDLLFAMLEEHLMLLIAAIEQALGAAARPEERFHRFIRIYVQKSARARRRHMVAINDLRFLRKARQVPLLALERKVVRLIAGLLRELNPGLDASLLKPYALMLVGMLNWTETWYRPGGAIKPQELCDRIARLFLRGLLAK